MNYTLKCGECGNEFITCRKWQVYCSYDCRLSANRKRLNYMDSRRWEILKEQVLEEANYRCVSCGSSKNLVCHHIVPKVDGGTDDIENLTILCSSCHGNEHIRLGELRNDS